MKLLLVCISLAATTCLALEGHQTPTSDSPTGVRGEIEPRSPPLAATPPLDSTSSVSCSFKDNPRNTAEIVFQSPYKKEGNFIGLDAHYPATSGWHYSFANYKEIQFKLDENLGTGSQEFEADILIRNRGSSPLVLENVICVRVSKL